MSLPLPHLGITLASSSLITCPSDQWEYLQTQIIASFHLADRWQPADLEKPLTVADVKSLRQFSTYSPVGERKVAFLPWADEFRVEVVNALLKLVEEPPFYLYIVLVAETDHLLPTLASRVRHLRFAGGSATIKDSSSSTSSSKWVAALEKYDLEEEKERANVRRLLYTHPLVHSGIKVEGILEALH